MTSPSESDAEVALREIIAERTRTRPCDKASDLTKREYFASQVISGLVSDIYTPTIAANSAVQYADALIEALNEASPPD